MKVPCTVPGCTRRVIVVNPDPLCRTHYKRKRAGKPLVDDRPAIGSPSGHGLYGIIDDDGETVLCHECGRRVVSVGNHLTKHDGMTAREYKITHGLPLGSSLASSAHRETARRNAAARVGSPAWRRLEGCGTGELAYSTVAYS